MSLPIDGGGTVRSISYDEDPEMYGMHSRAIHTLPFNKYREPMRGTILFPLDSSYVTVENIAARGKFVQLKGASDTANTKVTIPLPHDDSWWHFGSIPPADTANPANEDVVHQGWFPAQSIIPCFQYGLVVIENTGTVPFDFNIECVMSHAITYPNDVEYSTSGTPNRVLTDVIKSAKTLTTRMKQKLHSGLKSKIDHGAKARSVIQDVKRHEIHGTEHHNAGSKAQQIAEVGMGAVAAHQTGVLAKAKNAISSLWTGVEEEAGSAFTWLEGASPSVMEVLEEGAEGALMLL
jgi:hypothetical protein